MTDEEMTERIARALFNAQIPPRYYQFDCLSDKIKRHWLDDTANEIKAIRAAGFEIVPKGEAK